MSEGDKQPLQAPLFASANNGDYNHFIDLDELFADNFFADELDYSALFADQGGNSDNGGSGGGNGFHMQSSAPSFPRRGGGSGAGVGFGFSQSASVGSFDLNAPEGLAGGGSSSSSSSSSNGARYGRVPGVGFGQGVIMIPPSMPSQSVLQSMQKNQSAKLSGGSSSSSSSSAAAAAVPAGRSGHASGRGGLKSSAAAAADEDNGGGSDEEEEDDDDDDDGNVAGRGKKRSRRKSKSTTPFDSLNRNEKQKVERRERNREHAKRSRIRKKVLLDLLQDQLEELRKVNVRLRRVVTERLPALAPQILASCTTVESGLLADSETDEGNFSKEGASSSTLRLANEPREHRENQREQREPREAASSKDQQKAPGQVCVLMEPDYRLIQALVTSQQNYVLSDPSLPDNPIVYCSDGFCKLVGYKRNEVLGRNCRFLQGPGTDQGAVDLIRQGVTDGTDMSVCLLNYKADGSPFWNQFFVAAIRNDKGEIVNYVGVQCEVNSPGISAIKARVKRLPMPSEK